MKKTNQKIKKTKDKTIFWYRRKYQVIFIDENNNMFEVGWYNSLKDAEEDVNEYSQAYYLLDDNGDVTNKKCLFGKGKPLGELKSYPSTFSECFDRIIDVEDGCIQIRGFVRY